MAPRGRCAAGPQGRAGTADRPSVRSGAGIRADTPAAQPAVGSVSRADRWVAGGRPGPGVPRRVPGWPEGVAPDSPPEAAPNSPEAVVVESPDRWLGADPTPGAGPNPAAGTGPAAAAPGHRTAASAAARAAARRTGPRPYRGAERRSPPARTRTNRAQPERTRTNRAQPAQSRTNPAQSAQSRPTAVRSPASRAPRRAVRAAPDPAGGRPELCGHRPAAASPGGDRMTDRSAPP